MKNFGLKTGIASLAATLFTACTPKHDDRVGATPDNPMIINANLNACSTMANLNSPELRRLGKWGPKETLWIKCKHEEPNNKGQKTTLFSCTPTDLSSVHCFEEFRH